MLFKHGRTHWHWFVILCYYLMLQTRGSRISSQITNPLLIRDSYRQWRDCLQAEAPVRISDPVISSAPCVILIRACGVMVAYVSAYLLARYSSVANPRLNSLPGGFWFDRQPGNRQQFIADWMYYSLLITRQYFILTSYLPVHHIPYSS